MPTGIADAIGQSLVALFQFISFFLQWLELCELRAYMYRIEFVFPDAYILEHIVFNGGVYFLFDCIFCSETNGLAGTEIIGGFLVALNLGMIKKAV